jgi:hypothetical protein
MILYEVTYCMIEMCVGNVRMLWPTTLSECVGAFANPSAVRVVDWRSLTDALKVRFACQCEWALLSCGLFTKKNVSDMVRYCSLAAVRVHPFTCSPSRH